MQPFYFTQFLKGRLRGRRGGHTSKMNRSRNQGTEKNKNWEGNGPNVQRKRKRRKAKEAFESQQSTAEENRGGQGAGEHVDGGEPQSDRRSESLCCERGEKGLLKGKGVRIIKSPEMSLERGRAD